MAKRRIQSPENAALNPDEIRVTSMIPNEFGTNTLPLFPELSGSEGLVVKTSIWLCSINFSLKKFKKLFVVWFNYYILLVLRREYKLQSGRRKYGMNVQCPAK